MSYSKSSFSFLFELIKMNFKFFSTDNFADIKTNTIHILCDDLFLEDNIIETLQHETLHIVIHNLSKHKEIIQLRNEELIITTLMNISLESFCNNSICLANCDFCKALQSIESEDKIVLQDCTETLSFS